MPRPALQPSSSNLPALQPFSPPALQLQPSSSSPLFPELLEDWRAAGLQGWRGVEAWRVGGAGGWNAGRAGGLEEVGRIGRRDGYQGEQRAMRSRELVGLFAIPQFDPEEAEDPMVKA
ncbi:hypothetical protein AK812_SmicGene9822 [Symbiodinium microadriaticum]|uniref:Uncharacterized protein n=1 Tax=Symbiodinium microadriaticum TaxID=2951 RepID=A0A1Q9EHH3_SYMMI|nr:hypothetical protein AK812_SmicGene9822 [Symbiodinium microadriaticum]